MSETRLTDLTVSAQELAVQSSAYEELLNLAQRLDLELTRLHKLAYSIARDTLREHGLSGLLRLASDIASRLSNPELRTLVLSKIIQSASLRAAVLGPEGTFTHEVARRLLGQEAHLETCSTIRDVVKLVRDGVVSIGIIPFENSLEGIVHESLDSLEECENVFINMCVEYRINLCLAVSNDVSSMCDVEVLYCQPYAYAQCREFVSKFLKGLKRVVYVNSTAESAKIVRESSRAACLVSRFCAELYNLKVLAEHVEDRESYTKFVVISRVLATDGERSSIIFTIPHVPGALYRVLEVFACRKINLTMIYSRPTRRKPWHYYFYLEYEGSLTPEILEDLQSRCATLRVLGSYFILQLPDSSG